MGFKGKKNIYLCRDCGHGFVSVDIEEGTTPFMTKCLNCGLFAQSLCYAAPQKMLEDIKPAVEWYRPSGDELSAMSAGTNQHVKMGGLISRVTK